jgi:glycerophosphoryl diester phosphodiesterase
MSRVYSAQVNLHRGRDRPLVIGHRGAGALAAPNSLAALTAGVAAGADLVEFDVGRGLLLGHRGEARVAAPAHLAEALELLAPQPVAIEIDLKRPGLASEVVRLVGAYALEGRVAVSTGSVATLRSLAQSSPRLGRVASYPPDRLHLGLRGWPRARRARLPARLTRLLLESGAGAVALHEGLVDAESLAAVHDRSAALLAWTVNDAARVRELAELGVDALVSDDPRMVLNVLGTLNPT